MRLFLAPMEGVVDHHVRDLLTTIGGIDVCVTEFVRVTQGQRLPERVFKRLCPELDHHSKTQAGTPVRVQLLGGEPESLAVNARTVAHIGASAIDLNFGCPAKTVNKNDGGAKLLQQPHRVYDIVKAVRDAVPSHIPVSAKIRLGFEDRSRYRENALAVCEAGATELAVHARSKADGYNPPAYWEYLGFIRDAITIPVIANGEIWSPEDWQRCKQISGCEDLMIGRGLLARPDLALAIKAQGANYTAMPWHQMLDHLYRYYHITAAVYPKKHLGNRIKQWLMYLRLHYSEAESLFDAIKRERQAERFEQIFHEVGAGLNNSEL
ncbi:MAG: tRNA-dihydrouridine synthase [Cellvibrionaceae bacterium]